MNPYQKKCENCKWWFGEKYRKTITRGTCKRYPKYEDRKSNNFCGEYIPVLGRG